MSEARRGALAVCAHAVAALALLWNACSLASAQDKAKPQETDDVAFLKEVAKRLAEAVGGRWEVSKRERAPGLGPALSGGGFSFLGTAAPYIVLAFPLDAAGQGKLKAFQQKCSLALVVLGSNDRCTLLAGPSHDPEVSAKIITTLGLTEQKDWRNQRLAWAQSEGWLDFRLAVPDREETPFKPLQDGPRRADIRSYEALFVEKGPNAGRYRGDPYQWFGLLRGCDAPAGLVTTTEKSGARYLLLSAKPEQVLVSGPARPRPWGLKQVWATEDAKGRPALGLEFDDAAAQQLRKLTGANLGRPLAVLVNGNVLAVLPIEAPLADRLLLPSGAGGVNPAFLSQLLFALKEGMIGAGPLPAGGKTAKAVEWLKDKLDSFDLTVGLSPNDPGRAFALRSVNLRVTLVPREPHGVWPDGKPISADALVSREQAAKLIESLAKAGFFEIAGKYHSGRLRGEATGQRPPPPADSRPYGPPDRKDAHCEIRITASDGLWVAYFIASFDWNAGMVKYLDAIRAPLDGEAAKAMDQLLEPLGLQRKQWENAAAPPAQPR